MQVYDVDNYFVRGALIKPHRTSDYPLVGKGGFFLLYGIDKDVLFVGESKALLSHLRSCRFLKENGIKQDILKVRCFTIDTEDKALVEYRKAIWRFLVYKLKPQYNSCTRQPKNRYEDMEIISDFIVKLSPYDLKFSLSDKFDRPEFKEVLVHELEHKVREPYSRIDLKELKSLYEYGVTVDELAVHFKCSEPTIRQRLKDIKIFKDRRRKNNVSF